MPIEAPGFTPEAALGFSVATANYHRDITEVFRHDFAGKELKIDTHEFKNHMPLYIVGSSDRAMVLTWLNGDNFEKAFTELCFIGSALTENPDAAGANTKELVYFIPFMDARQDKRGRKFIPDTAGEKAIIKGQGITVPPLARAMRNVAGATALATLDLHSYDAAREFTGNGIEVVNLTAARLFADRIREMGLTGEPSVVVAMDSGDLNRAIPLSKRLGTDVASIVKERIPLGNGSTSEVVSRLAYGSVEGKRVFLFDDSISSGGTSIAAIDLLDKAGVKDIVLCATHPIFVDDYYENLEKILSNPKVITVMTTDSLPLEYRQPRADIPYAVREDGSVKRMEVIHVGPFLSHAADVILSSPTIREAKQRLGDDVWEIADPRALFTGLTGMEYPKAPETGIYYGNHRYGQLT